MEAKTNYTMVGFIVMLLAAMLVATGLWLSIGFDQKTYNVYAVYMNDAVAGLSQESDVKFNGVKVGFVKKIQLNHRDPQKVVLLLDIEQGIPITTSTSATLASQGITGTSYVSLTASSSELVLLKKKAGQEYPVIPAKPSLLTQLDKVITEVSKNINEVAKEVKHVFSEENSRAFSKSLANVQRVTRVLADNASKIDKAMGNFDVLINNAAVASKRLPRVLEQLDAGLTHFDQTMLNLKSAGKSFSSASTSAKVAIDAINQQITPPFVQLLNKLNVSATSLEEITNELERNPSILIRGREAAMPGPGE